MAGHCIAIIEMPILFEIEAGLAAGVELDSQIAALVDTRWRQLAIGDLQHLSDAVNCTQSPSLNARSPKR